MSRNPRANTPTRTHAFGQEYQPTVVDRMGVWLSARQIRRAIPSFKGKTVGDFGCGYQASFCRTILKEAKSVVLADLAIADDLRTHPKVEAFVGPLSSTFASIPSGKLDVVMCISVLEHLWDPQDALADFHRMLKPGGVGLFNVPSWRGRQFLEYSSFRLGASPADEMDDHKMYYDVKDFWPLLVRAGFKPSRIRCFSHKLGLNTFAICRKDA